MSGSIRINFEFPKEAYPFLKMICAQKGTSLKDFATALLLKAIEEYEDQMLTKKARSRLKELNEKDNISFDEACRLAEWKNDKKL
jgi:hypothetical protein